MYLFTITLLTTNLVISHASFYKKCCKFGEYLTEIDSSYECVEDKRKRLEIFSNETDFLAENSDGTCAEVTEDFFIFTVNNGTVKEKQPAAGKYFPKCCPINYTYNSIYRSCQETNSSTSFIKENFVKVGLPNCKVIVDHEFNVTDFNYDLINASTKVLKSNTLEYPGYYCIDENEKGSFVVRECKENLEVCEGIRCVKKCCPDGQSFINGSRCFDTYVHGLNLSSFSSVENPRAPYAIVHNRSCTNIYLMRENNYIFKLDEQGVFSLWVNRTDSYEYNDVGDFKSYCIEHTKKKSIEGYFFFMCFPDKPNNEKFQYTLWPKILSCVCLILTIAIYLILNERKKIFGKILVNYCIALLFENSILTYAQVYYLRPDPLDCKLRSFSIIFFATAAFSWSNVMCCDIWWTFGSARRTVGAHQRKRDFKKLLWYFLYGWGVPTILTLIIFLFYTYRILPYSIQPFMAVTKCFFEKRKGNYAHAIFFNLPHLIIQLVNMVLFVKTIMYCLKVKNEIDKINDTSKDDKSKKFERDKERLFLIIKLSVIMGVSFIFEVVSAFFVMSEMGPVLKYTEVVWDIINCLQGVFVFVIFICKKKVLHFFFVKFKVLHSKNLSSASIHTQSTITSNGTSMKIIHRSNENMKSNT